MKTITIRLPESLAAALETEACNRGISKSDVVREKLSSGRKTEAGDPLAAIADLIGSVDDDLPADLSTRKKFYLKSTGYGRKRHR